MLVEKDQCPEKSITIAAVFLVASRGGLPGSPLARSGRAGPITEQTVKRWSNISFCALKQIDAGVLNVGYAQAGPADGFPVIPLHGWLRRGGSIACGAGLPRDRSLSAWLWRPPHFLFDATARNGQQSVVAVDIRALMDALKIPKMIPVVLTGRTRGQYPGGAPAGAPQATCLR